MKYISRIEPVKIFVDTSAWVEFVLDQEKYHPHVLNYFTQETKSGSSFYTSDYVLDETFTRLLTRQSIFSAKTFKSVINRAEKNKELTILFTTELIFNRSWDYFEKFSEHLLSFTDATICTFVKDLKIDEVITLDQGFKKVGLLVKPDIK